MNANIHETVARHHLAWSIGTLDAEQEAMVNAHLDECEDCRESFRSDEENGRRHLPPAMISGWAHARDTLTGLERSAVAEHLEGCADCRGDLHFMGFDPQLDADPLPAGVAEPTAPARPKVSWRSLWLGSFGGAVAGAAAAILVLMSGPEPTPPGVVPWVAPSNTRGDAPQLELPKGTNQALVTLGVPRECDLNLPAEVIITGPDEASITTDVAPESLARGTLLVMINLGDDTPFGEYQVDIVQSGETLQTSRFQFTRRP